MDNFKQVRFVLIYTMALNLVATVAKIGVGYATGALSLIADGFDSFFDSFTNVIGLVAIYLSRRPPDEDHPYGHRRYEILMTLVVSVLLFLTCFQILRSAYERLMQPVAPQINMWSFGALFVSIGVHLYVSSYEERRGKELRSEFLIADALHTRADILVSVGVLLGLIVVRLGYPIVDTILAVIIAFLIAKIGIDIIRSSTRILTDAAALDIGRVADIVRQTPGVESFHHIRSRGQEDDIHLDLHIRVAPAMPLAQAHGVAHEVQRRLQEGIAGVRDVVIHVEPQRGSAHSPHADLFVTVQEVAQNMGLAVHRLNAYELEGRYSLDLHLEVPSELTLDEAHAQASLLEEAVQGRCPEVASISIHIEPAVVSRAQCDKMPEDSQVAEKVRQVAMDVPGMVDCHDVQVRRLGNELSLTLHCTLDGHVPLEQAHDVATLVEERIRRQCSGVGQVSVHVEPGHA